jgi:hypothetical protein
MSRRRSAFIAAEVKRWAKVVRANIKWSDPRTRGEPVLRFGWTSVNACSFARAPPPRTPAPSVDGIVMDLTFRRGDEQEAVTVTGWLTTKQSAPRWGNEDGARGWCRRARDRYRESHARSRLLVVERMMADRISSAPRDQAIARADLNMLVARGGRERTEAEFRALFESTGFRIDRIVPVALEFSVIEASPGAC